MQSSDKEKLDTSSLKSSFNNRDIFAIGGERLQLFDYIMFLFDKKSLKKEK